MFNKRFREALLLLLATVDAVVFDDEDVSDLRFFVAKNRIFWLANDYAIQGATARFAYVLLMMMTLLFDRR